MRSVVPFFLVTGMTVAAGETAPSISGGTQEVIRKTSAASAEALKFQVFLAPNTALPPEKRQEARHAKLLSFLINRLGNDYGVVCDLSMKAATQLSADARERAYQTYYEAAVQVPDSLDTDNHKKIARLQKEAARTIVLYAFAQLPSGMHKERLEEAVDELPKDFLNGKQ